MFKSKRILALVLAIAMLLPVMAGCGPKENKPVVDGEELELSIFFHIFSYCVFDDEWPVFTEAAKKTGIKLRGTAVETVSSSEQAYSTMLADATLPDIIGYNGADLKKAGMDGALIPLEDLIKEYAPNIQKLLDEYPEFRAEATAADGHIYHIPTTTDYLDKGVAPSKGWFIRTDWIDKLGLEVPKTVDELYEVFTAFKTQDPNGNGQADEIPYFSRAGSINDLFQLWDGRNSFEVRDGKFVAGQISDETKNAIINLQKWYKEGLVDKEIYSRGGQAREQLLSTDLGGSTHDWFSSTGSYNVTFPNLNNSFVTMAPPADVNGVVKENDGSSPVSTLGWGISKDNKHVEETMKYFDFWFTKEGADLGSCGIEGVHYNVVDGEKVFTDEVINADGGAPGFLRNIGCAEWGKQGTSEALLATMHEIPKKGYVEYIENKWIQPQIPVVTFNEDEQKVIDKYLTNINTLVSENEQRWILGKGDVEAEWDKYVSDLKGMGLDEVLAVYNSAYDRYLGR